MFALLLCLQAPFDAPPLDLNVASVLAGVRTFDADGDGDLDLLATVENSSATYVPPPLVLLRQGPLGFGRPETVAPGSYFLRYDTGDLDGDGDVDLVVRTGAEEISIGWNDGGGHFGSAPLPSLGSGLDAPCLVDLEGDGDLDVLYGVAGTTGAWNENLGAAVFAPGRPLDLGAPFDALRPADLDGDGLDDLLAEDYGSLRILRNLGGLQFDVTDPAVFLVGSLDRVQAVDLDGTGALDLVLTSQNQEATVVLDPLGSPTALSLPPSPTVAYDVDLDGDLDLVRDGSPLGLLWSGGDGTGQFAAEVPVPLTGSLFPRELHVADIDGDGRNDLVAPERWIRGLAAPTGGLALEGTTNVIAQRGGRFPTPLSFDLEGDGDLDLIAPCQLGPSIAVERQGPSTYAPPRTIDLEAVDGTRAIDVDGDGLEDLVGRRAPDELGWQRNLGGTFGAFVALDTGATLAVSDFEVRDLDGDGSLEVLFTAEYSQTTPHRLATVEWNGIGFGTPTTLATFNHAPARLEFLDVDGDGLDEAFVHVVPFSNAGRIVQLAGLPGGAFGPPTLFWNATQGLLSLQAMGPEDAVFPTLYLVTWSELLRFTWTATGLQGPSTVSHLETGQFDPVIGAAHVGRFFPEETWPYGIAFSAYGQIFIERMGISLPAIGPIGPGDALPVVADVDGDGDDDLFTIANNRRISLHRNTTYDVASVVFCGAGVVNSTGAPGRLLARGNPAADGATLELVAHGLPPQETALFLAAESGGFVVAPGGADGVLCLGGAIGRFTLPGQIGPTNGEGSAYLDLDIDALPHPTGSVPAMAGDLWRFQCWYRDGANSRLTEAIAVAIL